ncbi:hypothetical protein DIPPA_01021 [Diplonema papillatum]|nr:hypothetical protein DIPPA_01021 [Diplonema papillatum]
MALTGHRGLLWDVFTRYAKVDAEGEGDPSLHKSGLGIILCELGLDSDKQEVLSGVWRAMGGQRDPNRVAWDAFARVMEAITNASPTSETSDDAIPATDSARKSCFRLSSPERPAAGSTAEITRIESKHPWRMSRAPAAATSRRSLQQHHDPVAQAMPDQTSAAALPHQSTRMTSPQPSSSSFNPGQAFAPRLQQRPTSPQPQSSSFNPDQAFAPRLQQRPTSPQPQSSSFNPDQAIAPRLQQQRPTSPQPQSSSFNPDQVVPRLQQRPTSPQPPASSFKPRSVLDERRSLDRSQEANPANPANLALSADAVLGGSNPQEDTLLCNTTDASSTAESNRTLPLGAAVGSGRPGMPTNYEGMPACGAVPPRGEQPPPPAASEVSDDSSGEHLPTLVGVCLEGAAAQEAGMVRAAGSGSVAGGESAAPAGNGRGRTDQLAHRVGETDASAGVYSGENSRLARRMELAACNDTAARPSSPFDRPPDSTAGGETAASAGFYSRETSHPTHRAERTACNGRTARPPSPFDRPTEGGSTCESSCGPVASSSCGSAGGVSASRRADGGIDRHAMAAAYGESVDRSVPRQAPPSNSPQHATAWAANAGDGNVATEPPAGGGCRQADGTSRVACQPTREGSGGAGSGHRSRSSPSEAKPAHLDEAGEGPPRQRSTASARCDRDASRSSASDGPSFVDPAPPAFPPHERGAAEGGWPCRAQNQHYQDSEAKLGSRSTKHGESGPRAQNQRYQAVFGDGILARTNSCSTNHSEPGPRAQNQRCQDHHDSEAVLGDASLRRDGASTRTRSLGTRPGWRAAGQPGPARPASPSADEPESAPAPEFEDAAGCGSCSDACCADRGPGEEEGGDLAWPPPPAASRDSEGGRRQPQARGDAAWGLEVNKAASTDPRRSPAADDGTLGTGSRRPSRYGSTPEIAPADAEISSRRLPSSHRLPAHAASTDPSTDEGTLGNSSRSPSRYGNTPETEPTDAETLSGVLEKENRSHRLPAHAASTDSSADEDTLGTNSRRPSRYENTPEAEPTDAEIPSRRLPSSHRLPAHAASTDSSADEDTLGNNSRRCTVDAEASYGMTGPPHAICRRPSARSSCSEAYCAGDEARPEKNGGRRIDDTVFEVEAACDAGGKDALQAVLHGKSRWSVLDGWEGDMKEREGQVLREAALVASVSLGDDPSAHTKPPDHAASPIASPWARPVDSASAAQSQQSRADASFHKRDSEASSTRTVGRPLDHLSHSEQRPAFPAGCALSRRSSADSSFHKRDTDAGDVKASSTRTVDRSLDHLSHSEQRPAFPAGCAQSRRSSADSSFHKRDTEADVEAPSTRTAGTPLGHLSPCVNSEQQSAFLAGRTQSRRSSTDSSFREQETEARAVGRPADHLSHRVDPEQQPAFLAVHTQSRQFRNQARLGIADVEASSTEAVGRPADHLFNRVDSEQHPAFLAVHTQSRQFRNQETEARLDTADVEASSTRAGKPVDHLSHRVGSGQQPAFLTQSRHFPEAWLGTADVEASSTRKPADHHTPRVDSEQQLAFLAVHTQSRQSSARSSFRNQETEARLGIADLEASSRTDLVLRAWRIGRILLAELSQRAHAVAAREAAAALRAKDVDLLAEDTARREAKAHEAAAAKDRLLTRKEEILLESEDDLKAKKGEVARLLAGVKDRERRIEAREAAIGRREDLLANRAADAETLRDSERRLEKKEEALRSRLSAVSADERRLAEVELVLDREASAGRETLAKLKKDEECLKAIEAELLSRKARLDAMDGDARESLELAAAECEDLRTAVRMWQKEHAEATEEINVLLSENKRLAELQRLDGEEAAELEGRRADIALRESALAKRITHCELKEAALAAQERGAAAQQRQAREAAEQARADCDELCRERERLADEQRRAAAAAADLRARELDIQGLTGRLRAQEQLWVAWGDEVKAREKGLEAELQKHNGRIAEQRRKLQTAVAQFEAERRSADAHYKQQAASLDANRAAVDDATRQLAQAKMQLNAREQQVAAREAMLPDKENLSRALSCTRTVGSDTGLRDLGATDMLSPGTNAAMTPVKPRPVRPPFTPASPESSAVLAAARKLYDKTVRMQTELERKEADLNSREQAFLAKRRPAPAAAAPPSKDASSRVISPPRRRPAEYRTCPLLVRPPSPGSQDVFTFSEAAVESAVDMPPPLPLPSFPEAPIPDWTLREVTTSVVADTVPLLSAPVIDDSDYIVEANNRPAGRTAMAAPKERLSAAVGNNGPRAPPVMQPAAAHPSSRRCDGAASGTALEHLHMAPTHLPASSEEPPVPPGSSAESVSTAHDWFHAGNIASTPQLDHLQVSDNAGQRRDPAAPASDGGCSAADPLTSASAGSLLHKISSEMGLLETTLRARPAARGCDDRLRGAGQPQGCNARREASPASTAAATKQSSDDDLLSRESLASGSPDSAFRVPAKRGWCLQPCAENRRPLAFAAHKPGGRSTPGRSTPSPSPNIRNHRVCHDAQLVAQSVSRMLNTPGR